MMSRNRKILVGFTSTCLIRLCLLLEEILLRPKMKHLQRKLVTWRKRVEYRERGRDRMRRVLEDIVLT